MEVVIVILIAAAVLAALALSLVRRELERVTVLASPHSSARGARQRRSGIWRTRHA